MRIVKLLAVAAAVGLGAPAPSLADDVNAGPVDCGESVTAEILGVLLAAGNIDAAQYETWCAKVAAEKQKADVQAAKLAMPAVSAAADSAETGPTWKAKWDNGFDVSRSDGAFKLKFGGRIMVDGVLGTLSNDLEDDFRDAGIDPGDGTGVEFRRARIFFSGDVYDRIFFKAEYDFAQPDDDDNPDFTDVYLGLKKLGPVGSVQMGHFKEPMFLQESTSSKDITFMERGLNTAFFPGRNVGLMATGNLAEHKVLWQAGIFRDTNDQGFAFDDWGDANWDVAARLAGAPIYADDGAKVLHLGAGYIHRFLDSDSAGNLRIRERPESHLLQRIVDTGAIEASNADILNIELAGVHGPLSVQAEYTNSWVDGSGGQEDLHFWGVYGFVSYFLTGEHRAYELGKGRFARLRPEKNFDPTRGQWGAWETAARISYLDLTNANIDGGKVWDLTAGLNWYLTPNLRAMLNYIHSGVSSRRTANQIINGSGNSAQMRFQVDF